MGALAEKHRCAADQLAETALQDLVRSGVSPTAIDHCATELALAQQTLHDKSDDSNFALQESCQQKIRIARRNFIQDHAFKAVGVADNANDSLLNVAADKAKAETEISDELREQISQIEREISQNSVSQTHRERLTSQFQADERALQS